MFRETSLCSQFNHPDHKSGKIVKNHYKHSRDYDAIVQIHRQLEEVCEEWREQMPKEIWSEILESVDVDTFWTEFGSIFSEFLRYFSENVEHLAFVQITRSCVFGK